MPIPSLPRTGIPFLMGAAYPSSTILRTSFLASPIRLSLLGTIRSEGLRNPLLRACAAELETFACATFINAGRKNPPRSVIFAPLGLPSTNLLQRLIIPQPPGTRPAPISTRPMNRSACATILSAARHTSQPPPKVSPYGAATTGYFEYLVPMIPA